MRFWYTVLFAASLVSCVGTVQAQEKKPGKKPDSAVASDKKGEEAKSSPLFLRVDREGKSLAHCKLPSPNMKSSQAPSKEPRWI